MVIAAALSIQDPRERPSGADQQAAAELHGRFADPDSDFLAYLNLWTYLQELQDELGSSQFRRRCKAEFLHHLRIREWQDIHGQLRVVARSLGLRPTDQAGERDAIHGALLAGLLSHIGVQARDADERRAGDGRGRRDGRSRPVRAEYQGARGARFSIAPGSALFKAPPQWVMAAELVETDRLRARVAARIRPEWVERLAGHLVTRTYSEPRWEPRRGAVMANERVTLYGIPIVAGRRVPYGAIDPELARELFIRHALVEGDWSHHHAVLDDNAALVEEVRRLEDRARRRDILVDDETIFGLYDRRIAPDIVSARHFDRWWKDERRRRPDRLRFTFQELVSAGAAGVGPDDYPGTWRQDDLDLDLTYMFAPGDEGDGVTVRVPLPALPRLRADGFDWQVPGLREELVTALIRTLPKQIRRLLNPAPERARQVLAAVGPADGPLLETLEDALVHVAGVRLPPGSWALDRVPSHLRMTFQVEDETGAPLARGKDLEALRRRLQPRVRRGVARAAGGVERAGMRSWEFGTLPRVVEAPWAGHTVTAHPALVDEGDAVAVRALPTPVEQERAMWAGTRRLLLLSVPSPRRTLERQVANPVRLAVAAVLPGTSLGDLLDDCVAAGVDRLVAERGGPAWDEAGFATLLAAVRAGLPGAAGEVVRVVGQVLVAAQRVLARVDEVTTPALLTAVADVRVQVGRLLHPGFVTAAGAGRLPDLLRYLAAVEHRLTRLGDPRDADSTRRVQALEEDYERLAGARGAGRSAPEVEAVRWMIEELRVSLFAQHLGTAGKVSEPRVRREIERLAAGG
jgi:ATP-dependent helicase HrpA